MGKLTWKAFNKPQVTSSDAPSSSAQAGIDLPLQIREERREEEAPQRAQQAESTSSDESEGSEEEESGEEDEAPRRLHPRLEEMTQ